MPTTVPPALHVLRHDRRSHALIALSGEIDLDTAPLLGATLERCLHDGIRAIDVDLTHVTFCDCSGLNAFLYAALRTAGTGGYLRLHYPSPAVEQLFAVTGSGSLFLSLPDPLADTAPGHQTPDQRTAVALAFSGGAVW
ncbi:STAS domain-containing protein [Streptomyces sp. NBC_01537]|uniref:STAS domain-containing protein n=1 Tax=Streptomyces sp. NBC_01537 TaxID=2903896 RepID=UPI0038636881